MRLSLVGPLGMARWNIAACQEVIRRTEECYLLLDEKMARCDQIIEKLKDQGQAAVVSVERLGVLKKMLAGKGVEVAKAKEEERKKQEWTRAQRSMETPARGGGYHRLGSTISGMRAPANFAFSELYPDDPLLAQRGTGRGFNNVQQAPGSSRLSSERAFTPLVRGSRGNKKRNRSRSRSPRDSRSKRRGKGAKKRRARDTSSDSSSSSSSEEDESTDDEMSEVDKRGRRRKRESRREGKHKNHRGNDEREDNRARKAKRKGKRDRIMVKVESGESECSDTEEEKKGEKRGGKRDSKKGGKGKRDDIKEAMAPVKKPERRKYAGGLSEASCAGSEELPEKKKAKIDEAGTSSKGGKELNAKSNKEESGAPVVDSVDVEGSSDLSANTLQGDQQDGEVGMVDMTGATTPTAKVKGKGGEANAGIEGRFTGKVAIVAKAVHKGGMVYDEHIDDEKTL